MPCDAPELRSSANRRYRCGNVFRHILSNMHWEKNMKKLFLAAFHVAAVALALASTPVVAQSPFDGTWKTDLSKITFSTKPAELLFKDGMYDCKSCVTKTVVKTDGTDQKIDGNPYTDMLAVKIVDKNTVEITSKKGGKQSGWTKRTVAADGKSMTLEFKNVSPANGEVSTGTTLFKRIDTLPAGAHAASGSWVATKALSRSDNSNTITYKSSSDMMSMASPGGQSYNAKLDGNDSPFKGDPGTTTVSVKMNGKNGIEETFKRDGKVTGVNKRAVAADGKSMKVDWENKLAGTSGNFVMVKK